MAERLSISLALWALRSESRVTQGVSYCPVSRGMGGYETAHSSRDPEVRSGVTLAWGWDGRLKWSRLHGEGAGALRFTTGAVGDEVYAFGIVDGAIAPLSRSAVVANLGAEVRMECSTPSL